MSARLPVRLRMAAGRGPGERRARHVRGTQQAMPRNTVRIGSGDVPRESRRSTIVNISHSRFSYPKWHVCVIAHGDEIVFAGADRHCAVISKHMGNISKCQCRQHGQKQQELVACFCRDIRWTAGCLIHESDHRHTDRLVDEVGLTPGRMLLTPAMRESRIARNN